MPNGKGPYMVVKHFITVCEIMTSFKFTKTVPFGLLKPCKHHRCPQVDHEGQKALYTGGCKPMESEGRKSGVRTSLHGNSSSLQNTNQLGMRPPIMGQFREQEIQMDDSRYRFLDISYGLRSRSWCRSLKQVVQDLSTTVGIVEIASQLTSSPPLLDQHDDMADSTLDNTLTQSTQMTASAEDATPVFLIDPQSLPADTEVHLPPVSVETQTTLHLNLEKIILVIPCRRVCLQSLWTLSAFSSSLWFHCQVIHLWTLVAMPYYRVLNYT